MAMLLLICGGIMSLTDIKSPFLLDLAMSRLSDGIRDPYREHLT